MFIHNNLSLILLITISSTTAFIHMYKYNNMDKTIADRFIIIKHKHPMNTHDRNH